uniref:N-acetylglucosamine-1-phosphotransferase subunits alpha/beta-like n=1 Tax=Styela clava TaxID=7725 RepID=UPI00193AD67D|nr:N-acetylglucosamine-1-phosphotransferase subunits alpha/beta-like [Styela clava]
MRKEIFFKLLQRHTYTCLSHQYGIYFAFAGIVLVLYSMFQFGEEMLEWSQTQYDSVFSLYHDNIAGRSYQAMLAAPIPIDVVYTWVNGSDPILLSQLSALKASLNSGTMTLNTTSLPDPKFSQCLHKDCFLLPCLITNPMLGEQLTVSEAKEKWVGLSDLKWIGNVEVTKGFISETKATNVTILRFEDKEKVKSALTSLTELQNRTFQPLYITTASDASSSSQLRNALVLKGIPDKMNSDELKEKFPEYLKQISEWIYIAGAEHLALVWTNDAKKTATILDPKSNTTLPFFGIGESTVKISAAYMLVHVEEAPTQDDMARSRFEDNEELRYSLRSIEKFAPWIRKVFIVTNGQIPYWLNMDNPRIIIVTHEDIFVNKTHLPTFSSPAIESHIHRIPGLAKKFIYMNDDVMFGRPVWPDDFYTHSFGQKVYLTWPVPNCADGCAPTWIKDGFCDSACNVSDCSYDGGDCIGNNVRAGVGMSHGGYSFSTSSYCYPGCADTWLADKFCDQSCNKLECGFDAADCGKSNFDKIYKIKFRMENGTIYKVPHGAKSAYIDFSKHFGKITKAEYDKDKSIRTAAVSNKFNVTTLIYKSDGNESNIRFILTGESLHPKNSKGDENSNKTIITVFFNVTAFPSKNVTFNLSSIHEEDPDDVLEKVDDIVVNKTNSVIKDDFSDIITFPEDKKKPRVFHHEKMIPKSVDLPEFIDTKVLPENVANQYQKLEEAFQSNYITEKGYRKQKSVLLSPFLDVLKQAALDMNEKISQDSILKEMNAAKLGLQRSKNMGVALDFEESEEKNKVTDSQQNKLLPKENTNSEIPDSHANEKKELDSKDSDKLVDNRENQTNDFSEAGHQHNKGDTGQEEKLDPVEAHHESLRKPPNHEALNESMLKNPFYRIIKNSPDLKKSRNNSTFNESEHAFAGRKLLWYEEQQLLLNETLERVLHHQPKKTGFLPWEKERIFDLDMKKVEERERKRRLMNEFKIDDSLRIGRRKPLDAFADSLRYVSNIYNRDFGFTQRKVPAHMPHFVDRDIMFELQEKYTKEYDITSSHKLRHSEDMQFAFSYNYYLMSVKEPLNFTKVFLSLDTDGSKVLSDREIRTLATRTHNLPLTLQELTNLEKNIISCAWKLYGPQRIKEGNQTDDKDIEEDKPKLSEMNQPTESLEPWAVTEHYYDKEMPFVTEHLVLNCPFLMQMINSSYGAKPKYKHQVMDEDEITFKMIRSNVSTVVGQLDDIRKNPKKFICLNDNINHHNTKDAEMVKAVLRDFYETFFPTESQFELPPDYRNRFLDIYALRAWKERRDYISSWLRLILLIILFFTVISILWDRVSGSWRLNKNRFLRKISNFSIFSFSNSLSDSNQSYERKRRMSNV